MYVKYCGRPVSSIIHSKAVLLWSHQANLRWSGSHLGSRAGPSWGILGAWPCQKWRGSRRSPRIHRSSRAHKGTWTSLVTGDIWWSRSSRYVQIMIFEWSWSLLHVKYVINCYYLDNNTNGHRMWRYLSGPGKSTDRTCLQFCLQFIKIMMFCGLSPAIFSSLVSTSSGWVSGWCICAGSAPRTSRLPICMAWIGNTTDAMDVLTQVILNHEIQSRQYQILNLSFLI